MKKYSFMGTETPITRANEHIEAMKACENNSFSTFDKEQISDLVAFYIYVQNFNMFTRDEAVKSFLEVNEDYGVKVDEELCQIAALGTYFDLYRKQAEPRVPEWDRAMLNRRVIPLTLMNFNRAKRVLPNNRIADQALFTLQALNNYKVKRFGIPKNMNKFMHKIVKAYDKEQEKLGRIVDKETYSEEQDEA